MLPIIFESIISKLWTLFLFQRIYSPCNLCVFNVSRHIIYYVAFPVTYSETAAFFYCPAYYCVPTAFPASTVRPAWPGSVRKTIQSRAIAPVRAPICLNTNRHKHPQWYYCLKVILCDAFVSLGTTFLLIELPYKKMPSPLRPPPLQRSPFVYTPAYYQSGRFCSNSPLSFWTL